jgi:hypothetical protein
MVLHIKVLASHNALLGITFVDFREPADAQDLY